MEKNNDFPLILGIIHFSRTTIYVNAVLRLVFVFWFGSNFVFRCNTFYLFFTNESKMLVDFSYSVWLVTIIQIILYYIYDKI